MPCYHPTPCWQYVDHFGTIRKIFNYRKAHWWLARGGYCADLEKIDRAASRRYLMQHDVEYAADPVHADVMFQYSQQYDQEFWQLYDRYYGYDSIEGVYGRYYIHKRMTEFELKRLSDRLEFYSYAKPHMLFPCGICIGCQKKKAEEWALRCEHELSEHDSNCFVTLTYDDDHMPVDRGLHYSDYQNMMKRLRVYLDRHPEYGAMVPGYDGVISYLVAGEYGREPYYDRPFGRPHFHVIMFGFNFPDRYQWTKSGNHWLYRSPVLEELWPYGFSSIGEDANYFTARYTAKYVHKEMFIQHYSGQFNKLYGIEAPMVHVSSRPAIGARFAARYQGVDYGTCVCDDNVIQLDTYRDWIVDVRGRKHSIPRYYRKVQFKNSMIGVAARIGVRIDMPSPIDLYRSEQVCYSRIM